MGILLVGASVPLCRLHEEERAFVGSQRPQTEGTKEAAPEHPSVKALLGATNGPIIQMAEQVYWGEWTLAPSMLCHHQQDECMRELWQELGRQRVRAGLQGAGVMRSSRSRRCSWGYSASWTHYPSAESKTREAAKQLRGDFLLEWSRSWRQCSWLRYRSSSRQHQSPSPECQRQSSFLSPSTPRSGPLSDWLFLHMWDLKLQARA